MSDNLPALPVSDVWTRYSEHGPEGAFSATLVRVIQREARKAALIEAAELCERFARMMEAGAGQDSPGHRHEQCARILRERAK